MGRSGARSLPVAELIEQTPVWHEDCLGIAGAFTEAATHNAQERLNHINFTGFIDLEDFFRADLDALHTAVA